MTASATLILTNSNLLKSGFNYPFTILAMGQIFTFTTGICMHISGIQQINQYITIKQFINNILLIAFVQVLALYFGNTAYLYLSVSFIQAIKGLVPFSTLIFGVLFGLKRVTLNVVLSLVLMFGGSAVTATIQRQTANFSLLGFNYFVVSAVCEGLRIVMLEKVQRERRFNVSEMVVYNNFALFAIASVMAVVFEGKPMLAECVRLVRFDVGVVVRIGVLTVVTNLSQYWAIRYTNSLYLKVCGCMRNTLVGIVGFCNGEFLQVSQQICYFVAVFGFLIYCSDESNI